MIPTVATLKWACDVCDEVKRHLVVAEHLNSDMMWNTLPDGWLRIDRSIDSGPLAENADG